MANEYKAWYRGNDPQNAREGLDEYDRPFGERYERPPEYQDVRGDAYRHYPEIYDITADREKKQGYADDKKSQEQTQDKSRQSRRAQSARAGQTVVKSVVQSIVGHVVAIVVGAVVLVGGYRAIEAQKAASQPVVAVAEWSWSEDGQTATVALKDEGGNVIRELPATVEILTEDPTCTQDGHTTYTATVVDGQDTYSDVHSDLLPAIGHAFDKGKVINTENGPMIEYECTHCHEKFTVTATIDEND